jgi:hypothetical protein
VDQGISAERMGVIVRSGFSDVVSIGTTRWKVERFGELATAELKHELKRQPVRSDFYAHGFQPYSVTGFDGNLITNAGWTRLMSLLTATGSTQALSATAVRIGVGNSNTAESYTDTDLGASAGSSNRWFQPVTGAATLGTRTLEFEATFGTSDGNFAWNEFGIDVGTPTVTAGATVGTLLFNHVAGIAQGTKAAGQTWTATATITFS